MNEKLKQWRESGNYLPQFLRDFHDQKDVFKTIHNAVNVEGHEYCKDINWAKGHCYVIDIFLWYMARKGYTLQRSRQKLEFEDIADDIAARKEQESKAFAKMLETSGS